MTFAFWLAWQDDPDRLFVAAEIVDDIHVITYDRDSGYPPSGDASVWFYVDGDKSGGGPLIVLNHAGSETPYNMNQAQIFGAFAGTYGNGSNVGLDGIGYVRSWIHELPYADAEEPLSTASRFSQLLNFSLHHSIDDSGTTRSRV